MKRANILYLIITFCCIVGSIVIGCIYRPLSEKQVSRKDKTLHYTLTLNTTTIILSIEGSGTVDNHSQIRKVHDHTYNLLRTGYISIYQKEGSLYGIFNDWQQDIKRGSATHKTIDKVLSTAIGKVIKIIDIQSFEKYIHHHQWPYEKWEWSQGNISIHLLSYCRKMIRKRDGHYCRISGRIIMPGTYRPIYGDIHITKDRATASQIPDLSHAISVEDLLRSVR